MNAEMLREKEKRVRFLSILNEIQNNYFIVKI
jgi:hypothetical protein